MAIDVFHGTGIVQWPSVKAAGHSLAIVKVSDGPDEIDAYGPQNVAGAKAAGMQVGVYHFARVDGDGAQQAAHAVNAAHAAGWQAHTDVKMFLDLESVPLPGGGTLEDSVGQARIREFVEAFGSQYSLLCGSLPGIYIGKWFSDTYLGDGFGGHSLWLPDYYTQGGVEVKGLTSLPIGVQWPALPIGWQAESLWQWTQYGTCDGIGVNSADLSIVAGGEAGVAALIG